MAPLYCITPSLMNAMWVAHFSKSDVMWVENSTLRVPSATMRRSSSVSSSRDTGSRPLVGSSRISSLALWLNARAIMYFTFMPLDSWSTRLLSSRAKSCK